MRSERAPGRAVLLAALLSAGLMALPAGAQESTADLPPESIVTLPVIRSDVVFRIPRGFLVRPGVVDRKPTSYQAIFYPLGHTTDNWSERLRLLVVRGHLKDTATPAQALLDTLISQSRAACLSDMSVIPEATTTPARAAALWICKGSAEQKRNTLSGYYHVALGEDDSYILMREQRIASTAASLLPSEEEVHKWKKDTDTLNICPLGGAPCGPLGEVPR